ncbi:MULTISPECIES: virulence [Negativicutes]|mgnify:FL=1|jgi:hypothetical protein|uniref:virulence n=1 Tax=Dialister hominis TaxID=2582419 RepID=UPI00206D3697|nr:MULTISPECIES: virulence [Negativicutes]DAU86446.1 MAG TPA: hypothetical protein [Caudoviricetes sp.]
MMKAEYNKQGAARKELADAISQITGESAKYLFLPTKAYQIGSIMVGETGTVECEDEALFQKVVQELAAKGFRPENRVPILEEGVKPGETSEMESVDTLTISLPDNLTEEDFVKLQNLVASKASLFKKALGTNDLTIQRGEGKISFPWFHEADSTKVQVYTKLVTALCQMAKKSKRITAKEHEVPNEKYAFRCFLLRLGFIGSEYKDCRKILLEKLSGSAAYRDGGGKDAVSQ